MDGEHVSSCRSYGERVAILEHALEQHLQSHARSWPYLHAVWSIVWTLFLLLLGFLTAVRVLDGADVNFKVNQDAQDEDPPPPQRRYGLDLPTPPYSPAHEHYVGADVPVVNTPSTGPVSPRYVGDLGDVISKED